MLQLYNTLTRAKEPFSPLHPPAVGLYTCGPTVYHYYHIGNLRTAVFQDTLKRALKQAGFTVTHVMNITDVGHLTDDADDGEDKMEKGSKREGKTAWEIAEFYTKACQQDLKDMNILEPTLWCKATDHIPEQIRMVQELIEKGYTYETPDGIYFDTTKLKDYGALAGLKKQELLAGARVDMGEKKNPHDFALWKFSKPEEKRQMEWNAFDKKGFPGWHIECSAMAVKYLGEQFDIHCGGIDLIPIHHTNEIAQTEAVTNKRPWVKWWMHGEFINVNGDKMSKSGENFITLQTLKDRGFSPLDYRYFLLQAHYRKQLGFSWEALQAARTGLERLRRMIADIPEQMPDAPHVMLEFTKAIEDDLNTPEALAVLWNGLKESRLTRADIVTFDKVLGLKLLEHEEEKIDIPDSVHALLDARVVARDNKQWGESDRLRDELKTLGFAVEDTDGGQKVKRARLE